jgi:hypothetical protein
VSGTLADGTPINVAYTEALGGRVYVNNQYSEQVSSGFWPGLKIRRARLQLPPGLRPSPTDCNAGVQPAVAVDFDQIPNGELLIEGMEIATDPGDIPHQDAIPIEIRQFGLQSVEPVLGTSGVEQMLFYTLQSERGVSASDPPPGPVSTGTATIDFAMRSFTLETELFYDIRGGAEDGPILSSGSDSLMTTEPVPWSPVDASGAFAAGPDDPFSPGEAAGGFFSIELEGSDFDLAVGQPEPAVAIPILGTLGHAVLALLVSGVGFARARRSESDHSR